MHFKNKKILIIGGTGTIGKRLVKELIKQEPKAIRIFSRDEYKQFMMKNELGEQGNIRFLVGDVRDYDRLTRACQDIDIIFNLAAMKHVSSCEYNPTEAIKTNVIGMENVITAARKTNVEIVVFTSSDKAINPTNVYGATKLLAERLVMAASTYKGSARTKFVAVRFGNVMGSRGSVIPLFMEQILENKKITITDETMSRFMMTLKQAVKLTMGIAEKSVDGEIFVLKMPVINLKDLTEVVIEEMAKLHGFKPEEIEIEVIGQRPGEKLYEELMTKEESKYAYDLGQFYAVIPVNHDHNLYYETYKHYKKAGFGSYCSSDVEPISKEEVRQLIMELNLIKRDEHN